MRIACISVLVAVFVFCVILGVHLAWEFIPEPFNETASIAIVIALFVGIGFYFVSSTPSDLGGR